MYSRKLQESSFEREGNGVDLVVPELVLMATVAGIVEPHHDVENGQMQTIPADPRILSHGMGELNQQKPRNISFSQPQFEGYALLTN
jgi:hypothetical protein